MKKGDLIAVYGTLRPGNGANRYLIKKAKHLGQSRVSGKIYNLGHYPGVKLDQQYRFLSEGPTVVVDLYEIESDDLPAMLDGYEGYPYLYDRKIVEEESGKRVWIYEYNHAVNEDRLISSGDWEKVGNNVEEAV